MLQLALQAVCCISLKLDFVHQLWINENGLSDILGRHEFILTYFLPAGKEEYVIFFCNDGRSVGIELDFSFFTENDDDAFSRLTVLGEVLGSDSVDEI